MRYPATAAPTWALPDAQRRQKAGHATLLALDGRCVERLALPLVTQLFHGVPQRLDILVVNSPKAATTLLGALLMDLERHGIDYRLTSTEGHLNSEILHYVRRIPCVSVILVDCQERWEGEATLDSLRGEGYRVISFLYHGQAEKIRATVMDGEQREAV